MAVEGTIAKFNITVRENSLTSNYPRISVDGYITLWNLQILFFLPMHYYTNGIYFISQCLWRFFSSKPIQPLAKQFSLSALVNAKIHINASAFTMHHQPLISLLIALSFICLSLRFISVLSLFFSVSLCMLERLNYYISSVCPFVVSFLSLIQNAFIRSMCLCLSLSVC